MESPPLLVCINQQLIRQFHNKTSQMWQNFTLSRKNPRNEPPVVRLWGNVKYLSIVGKYFQIKFPLLIAVPHHASGQSSSCVRWCQFSQAQRVLGLRGPCGGVVSRTGLAWRGLILVSLGAIKTITSWWGSSEGGNILKCSSRSMLAITRSVWSKP